MSAKRNCVGEQGVDSVTQAHHYFSFLRPTRGLNFKKWKRQTCSFQNWACKFPRHGRWKVWEDDAVGRQSAFFSIKTFTEHIILIKRPNFDFVMNLVEIKYKYKICLFRFSLILMQVFLHIFLVHQLWSSRFCKSTLNADFFLIKWKFHTARPHWH